MLTPLASRFKRVRPGGRVSFQASFACLLLMVAAVPGCFAKRSATPEPEFEPSYQEVSHQVDLPDLNETISDDPRSTPEPRSLRAKDPSEQEYWDLDLDETVHYGLSNSRILMDAGGTVIRNPDALQSNLSPAIAQLDPRFGIDAALSAFDAQFSFTGNFENNDRAINNLFASGGVTARVFEQDLNTYRTELSKRSATGGLFAVRNVTEYDSNNAPANLFPSAWTTYYEGEVRQPLLQGAGTRFNRIAGPNATVGQYNGVVIARVNADISQADFEIAVREYLSNVENAYWDLYYAYRDLDAKIAARDDALKTWKGVEANKGVGKTEGYREAQARDQYFRLEQEVKNALTGRRLEGTRTFNGSPGGTFRATPGVYLAERRLRLLMGITSTDYKLIRPRTEPTRAQIIYDWELCKTEALERRPELQRQKFRIQRCELELVAARNFLKPRLDAVGKYRFRGFGDDLLGTSGSNGFRDAYGNLAGLNFQEWTMGVEFNAPLGYRKGHAAVAFAQYRLAKERSLLREQERQVIHDLGNAVAEIDRSYEVAKLAYDRREASQENLRGLQVVEGEGTKVSLDTLQDAQRRVLDADIQYHLAMVDYQIAQKNVNLEKGSLLDYHNIMSSESGTTATDSMKTDVGTSISSEGVEAAKRTLQSGSTQTSAPRNDPGYAETPVQVAPPAASVTVETPDEPVGAAEVEAAPETEPVGEVEASDYSPEMPQEQSGDVIPTGGENPGPADVELLDAPPEEYSEEPRLPDWKERN